MAVVFAAGAVSGLTVALWLRSGVVACRTGDLTQGFGQASKGIEKLFGGWIHQVRACRVGEYLVVTPAQGSVPDILLSRNGKPFLVASETVTMVMGDDHVLFDRERGRKLSVAAYNPAQKAWIENVDVNADGTIDWRTTEADGRPTKHEIRFGDRWFEVIRRDGQSGTIVNGQFMSIDQARAHLGLAEP